MSNRKYISTTALSKLMNVSTSDLFTYMKEIGWMERAENTWTLTNAGKEKGGQFRSDSIRGTWVVWPETIIGEIESIKDTKTSDTKYVNATVLSQILKVSKLRINPILSELGWLERDRKGWILTKLGESIGGKQLEDWKMMLSIRRGKNQN
ncbi:MAG TPA: hypothetical protein VE710_23915 [Candidatus Bathyarchaeia archaeon]|nr:hypothetical protein [Candidatus Bathyarchaeia archaeon]